MIRRNYPKYLLRYLYGELRIGLLVNYFRAAGNRNAVFIWVPKAAGTSLFLALSKSGCPKIKELEDVRRFFPGRGLVTFGHMDYFRLVHEGYLATKFTETAFKFGFTRNPFDRAVSLYFYLQSIGEVEQALSFKKFLRMLKEHGFDPIGLYTNRNFSRCNPQVSWLQDSLGSQTMDFVGRYENLDDDFNRVSEILGLPRKVLTQANKSSHSNFGQYYDQETKDLVLSIYKDDFQAFGYPETL